MRYLQRLRERLTMIRYEAVMDGDELVFKSTKPIKVFDDMMRRYKCIKRSDDRVYMVMERRQTESLEYEYLLARVVLPSEISELIKKIRKVMQNG